MSLCCHLSCILTPKCVQVGAGSNSVTFFNRGSCSTELSIHHRTDESGQQRVYDECHVISLTVVNINTVTLSWGRFIFEGHRAQIRSDDTSDVAYINPQSGMFSCQLLSLAQKRRKTSSESKVRNRSCQGLSPHRGGEVDSSQSFQELKASHMLSILSQESMHWKMGLLLNLTIMFWEWNSSVCKRRSHVGSCVEGCNACWSHSDTAYFSVLQGLPQTIKGLNFYLKACSKCWSQSCMTMHRTTFPIVITFLKNLPLVNFS